MPEHPTFVEHLRWRSQTHPERTAFQYFPDGEHMSHAINYRTLDQQAMAIAAHLQERQLNGQTALLVYPPGLEFIAAFLGCLYAGVIAVPAYPPEPHRIAYSLQRLQAIIQDAGTQVVMTTTELHGMAQQLMAQVPGSQLEHLIWLTTDTIDIDSYRLWFPPSITKESLAFLQYTSGSTAAPKGVMVSHHNLLYNEGMIQEAFEHREQENILVCWVPFYHDMGLVGHLLQSLFIGSQTLIMPPIAFLQKPYRWLKLISDQHAHSTGAPNFAYDLCVRKVSPEQRDALDLSSWTLALNGAEPLNHATIERFCNYFAPCGFKRDTFYPSYGMAETTVFISGSRRSRRPYTYTLKKGALEKHQVIETSHEDPDAVTWVSSGQAWWDEQIRIVNPETDQLLPANTIGEIWVSGPHVAQGYWKRPEETAAAFHGYLENTGEGPFLKTGDLGFLKDGELFVTGRIKDMLIIRGRNIYPQDIERTVESLRKQHPAIRPGCGVAISTPQEQPVILQEIAEKDEALDLPTLATDIIQAVNTTHDLAVHSVVLLKAGTLPKTSSGKLMRQACRKAFENDFKHSDIQILYQFNRRECSRTPQPRQDITQWIQNFIAQECHLKPETIDTQTPFQVYGVDSLIAVQLVQALSDKLKRPLYETLLWDYPTIERLVSFLNKEPQPLPSDSSTASTEAIAIIGMACRFPGQADTPEAFWDLLKEGRDGTIEYPATRENSQKFLKHPAIARGGFLEDISGFEPEFFGISPREAEAIDPQQRLLLEVTWEAIERAGQVPEQLKGSQTGVFIGISTHDYKNQLSATNPYMGTGNSSSTTAGRISYIFDWHGPSLAIDTACSSSLVAIHMACQSLREGESDMAVAGGVNLILNPETSLYFSTINALSSDGRCKTFDAAADGYVRSEGCGMVVLKRLSDAQNDPILGIIRSSAVNHDGQSNGLTAPNGQAQQRLIEQALKKGGLQPDDIHYLEAHGTGTPLGDPIELRALNEALCQNRSHPLWLSSVKTNIGHLEAAAGIAGLIKVLLMIQHRQIPPHLHLQKLNPIIPSGAYQIPQELTPWEPTFAGISSFGISGTNAHLVVGAHGVRPCHAPTDSLYILALSAKSPEALAALRQRYQDELASDISLADLCYTANVRRSHHPYRTALVFDSYEALQQQLAQNSSFEPRTSYLNKVIFVFPGQGAQWVGMGQQLFKQEPVFQRAIDRCQKALDEYVPWDLVEILTKTGDQNHWQQPDTIQPILFAIQIALAELWISWGIQPDAVIGHSMGEVAAAYIAGALDLPTAARIICERSRLLQKRSGEGGMILTDLTETEALLQPNVSLAAINGPTSTVLSGDRQALTEIQQQLENQQRFCRWIQVDVASHSSQMDDLIPDLQKVLDGIQSVPPKIPFYSTVLAQELENTPLDTDYWIQNLRQPVQFSQALQAALEDGVKTCIEISPHPLLLTAIAEHQPDTLLIPSLRRQQNEEETMLRSLAELYSNGYPVNWKALYPQGQCLPLPPYPWQRQRYWAEKATGEIQFYQVAWKPKSLVARSGKKRKNWLVIGGYNQLTETLDMLLSASGQNGSLVSFGSHFEKHSNSRYQINPNSPQDYQRLWDAIGSLDGIVYLGNKTSGDDWTSLDIFSQPCMQLIHLLQALDLSRQSPRLYIITHGVQSVAPNLIEAPLWGLGRVIQNEYPALECTLLDLPTTTSNREIQALFTELKADSEDTQVLLSPPQRLVFELSTPVVDRMSCVPTGSFLITGGLGALGLTVAQWLSQQGVKHLALMGRSEPTSQKQILSQLEADVTIIQGDVSQEKDVRQALAHIQATMPPLKGIIHAAGVLDDGILTQMTQARFESVMAAKIMGSWHLHHLTSEIPLEHFILFSSMASLIGSPGQGNYAAANAFMDALAHYRHTQGLPALSINWGPWGEVGLATGQRTQELLETHGIQPIQPSESNAILEYLFTQLPIQVGVMKHIGEFKIPYREGFKTISNTGTPQKKSSFAPRPSSLDRETLIKNQVATILRLPPTRLDSQVPLRDYGFDSLMALELKTYLEKQLQRPLSTTDMANCPTIASLVDYCRGDYD